MSVRAPALFLALLLVTPTSAHGDDVHLAAEDLELVPLTGAKKRLLFLRHGELLGPLGWRIREVTKVRAQLAKAPQAEGPRKRLENLNAQIRPALLQVEEILRKEGVDDEQLARLRGFPPGPRRPHRFAHSLVLGLQTLDAPRRERLSALVAGVDGAQLALIALRKRAERGSDEGKAQRIQQLNQQINQIERRFWRLIDALLDRAEKVAVRRHLPHGVTQVPDPLGHALRLPGLTPSQGARLQALVAEVEAETAADNTETRRLQLQIQALPQPERAPLQARVRETQLRVAERVVEAAEAGRALLTPAQWDAFQAIPPFVSPQDRRRDVRKLIEGMDLSAAQMTRLRAIGQRIKSTQQELQGDMRRIGRMSEDYGPDSPQMQSMALMRMGVEREGQVVARAVVREVFVEILSPTQATGWVVGLYNEQ